MSFSLPDVIIRRRDADRVCEELRGLQTQELEPDALVAAASEELRAIIAANQQLWQESSIAQFLEAFQDALKRSPSFDIILPVYPHDSFLSELVGWFRREIHPDSLLDISVRRQIGGGIVVRSKNRMFDLSFRPKIIGAKDKIPEVLGRV